MYNLLSITTVFMAMFSFVAVFARKPICDADKQIT